ncbi:MAG: tyrosine-type recombinase/integrase [Bacteroidetes bacterium]|nr:tyrosine-type recombinase/integrase [Deltaproteobacteria bacterium]MBT4638654.1 tyrosine-type recombinase/integrase [Deltaproteobacteria bacterium]MBT6614415.1 tyrosine-type recombinase/integrase [Deltaproteobacteria bacterium]MBT7039216.1 tyrosine-type recombinase/integrase [Bacteroidota bacterium]MBT7711394.1 tyrosine-type recombinase/integrase [Deltaproteobacteria bacterium]
MADHPPIHRQRSGNIQGFEGTFVVQCALQITPYVFLRSGELRGAEWEEFDFDNSEWRIPAERMKMKVMHIVPLARRNLVKTFSIRAYNYNFSID